MTAQHIINSLEFARKSLEVHDIMPVFQMTRLHDALSSREGGLKWRLAGSLNAEGEPMLHLQLSGVLHLECGRCLESFDFELNIDSKFTIVSNESLLPAEENDIDDEVDYLVADSQLQIAQLIEDEVLLALPYAPKHDVAICGTKDKMLELGKPNPFIVLQNLKVNKT